jgi:hypothetical protein
MRKILAIVEGFLRKYPAPSEIKAVGAYLLRLKYSYSSPYTDSKHLKELLFPLEAIPSQSILQSPTKDLAYNDKGYI